MIHSFLKIYNRNERSGKQSFKCYPVYDCLVKLMFTQDRFTYLVMHQKGLMDWLHTYGRETLKGESTCPFQSHKQTPNAAEPSLERI